MLLDGIGLVALKGQILEVEVRLCHLHHPLRDYEIVCLLVFRRQHQTLEHVVNIFGVFLLLIRNGVLVGN